MGLPGTDKSSILKKIQKEFPDVMTINTDKMVSSIYSDQQFLENLYEHYAFFRGVHGIYRDEFGSIVLNKQEFGECLFRNQEHLDYLYRQVHPIVLKQTMDVANKHSKVVIECPVPFKANLAQYCNKTYLIDCPTTKRLSKVVERGWTIDDMLNRDKQILLDLKDNSIFVTPIVEDDIIAEIKHFNDSKRPEW